MIKEILNDPVLEEGWFNLYSRTKKWEERFCPEADVNKNYYHLSRAFLRWIDIKVEESNLIKKEISLLKGNYTDKQLLKKQSFKPKTKRVRLFKSKTFYGVEFELVEYNIVTDLYFWNIKLVWGLLEISLFTEFTKTKYIAKEKEKEIIHEVKYKYIDKHLKEFSDDLNCLKQFIHEAYEDFYQIEL